MPDTLAESTVHRSDTPVPLRLKPNRQYPFLARHPWVHAHALQELGEGLPLGQVVDLLDHDGNWLGRGLINPKSRLRIRLYAFDEGIGVDSALFEARIEAAIARRQRLETSRQEAERLVFSESDLLSGIIVDRYADCLSVQFTAGGLWTHHESILDHLKRSTDSRTIKYGVDARTAKLEGIEAVDQWHEGVAEQAPVEFQQNGLQLSVHLDSGQKTGGYLDQRLNHRAAAKYMRGRRVLDVCCYQGGFGLVAAAAGAKSVLGIDSSEPALDAARQNAQRNGLQQLEFERSDCFDALKRMSGEGQTFDAVILDPPRFAGSRHEVDAALRAYKRLNSWAVDLLPPGGLLVTCSCSGRVGREDFLNMLTEVGKRRKRDLVLMENLGPAPDHPVAASCPESDYLKCVIAEVW